MTKSLKQKRIKNKSARRKLSLSLTSGLAQSMVILNGIIITVTAFLIFSYFINDMTVQQNDRTSQAAGRALVDGISSLENSMRLTASVLRLSETRNKNAIVAQIRRNIPNLRNFDQLLWLYEESPGNWQYKTISKSNHNMNGDLYELIPDMRLIARLKRDGFIEGEDMHMVTDFDGMKYQQEVDVPKTMVRSFALVQTVKSNSSYHGVVIGISHASLIFQKGAILENEAVSRLTIRDKKSQRRLFHMVKDEQNIQDDIDRQQTYSFFVADGEWQIILDFTKDSNHKLLEKIPFVVLFFGVALTAVGTLFIRNNYTQSSKLASVNVALEQKNDELEAEISERERLNDVLAVAERDNRAIIDSVSDVIFEAETNGDVLFLSASWQKVTGFDTERLIGNNLFSMLHPEDQEKQQNDFDLLVKGQKQAYRSFTKIRIADGTFRAVELAFSMIRQDEHKKMRVVGTITDVEERRRAERALAEAEKKYRTIVENAAGGLYQLTPEGMYLSANPAMARILGYASPEEMLRMIRNANGIVYPDTQEREVFVEKLKQEKQVFGYETQVLTKDGARIWVRENIRVVHDDSNNILYFEGSMEDITQRKDADMALIDAKMQSDIASRAKTEFIANMSHELRTPLNAIIGFSDIMKNEIMGPLGQDMYKEYVSDIHNSGKGLLKVINEILDISKIEAGNRDLNESEFDMRGVVGAALDLYERRLAEKNITLINDINDYPVLLGEELSIKQVLGNIYSNAIQYTPNGGRITALSDYGSDGAFKLSITDTGVGMTGKEIDQAMKPFNQLETSLDRTGSGTGLGLTLANAIMTLHGGKVEIVSEKSIGTTVTLIFPQNRVQRKSQDHTV